MGSESPYCKYSMRQKRSYAFRNNYAKSERIWTKPRTVWAKCGGLALADFGRDQHSSDSLEVPFLQKKRKKWSQNFQVLRLHAVITLQWLQTAGNGPSTWCLVSIFTITINSKSFPWAVRCAQETYLPRFSAIVDGHRGCLAESWCKSKQTDVGVAAVRRCVSK